MLNMAALFIISCLNCGSRLLTSCPSYTKRDPECLQLQFSPCDLEVRRGVVFANIILSLSEACAGKVLYWPSPASSLGTFFRTMALHSSTGQHYTVLYVKGGSGVEWHYGPFICLSFQQMPELSRHHPADYCFFVFDFLVLLSRTSSHYFSSPPWTHRHTEIHTDVCTHAHFWLNVIHP